MIYHIDAFSLYMTEIDGPTEVQIFPLKREDVKEFLKSRPYTKGHNVKIKKNDIAIIEQTVNEETKYFLVKVREVL
jgi:hypothetical protein